MLAYKNVILIINAKNINNNSLLHKIIRELNNSLKIETEQSGKEIITFPGRVPIWYFNKKLGIEGNK